jgi:uncharacterized membrane protein YqgA involved in biofilm formation
MLGTIVNSLAIIVGSLLGLLFRKGIADNYKEIIMSGVGLSVLLIGIKSAIVSDDLMVVLFSVLIGALIGEYVGIEHRLELLGKFLEGKVASKSSDTGSFARGFVTASLVFCVGSMAIVGALESGLTGNHQILFAKSILDGVMSIVFASAMGLGVMFSCVAVFIYQGLITITSMFMKDYLTPETVTQMSSVGGLLIMAIGMNALKITKIKVGNLVPAVFLPLVYYVFRQLVAF